MRIKRWRDLSALEKLAFEKRWKRSGYAAVLGAVGIALMQTPGSWFHMPRPTDTAWTPLIKGLFSGTFIFGFSFLFATRFKSWMREDDDIIELNDAIAREKEAVESGNDAA